MYAVVDIKGEQVIMREGEKVRIPFQAGLEEGATLELDRVLLIQTDKGTKVGSPLIEGAKVSLEVAGPVRDRKVLVYKKKRRKNYRRRAGHRQVYTEAVVSKIQGA